MSGVRIRLPSYLQKIMIYMSHVVCVSIPLSASLHCKWNLVIALAAVTAHHVRAGDLLQPGLAEFE